MTETSSNPPTAAPLDSSITVDIYDQTYRLRGQDTEYIHHLASIVDGKMRLVASQGKTVDSLRVAVLAALNIADELARSEERLRELESLSQTQSSIRSRASSLNGLLDSLLTLDSHTEDRRAG